MWVDSSEVESNVVSVVYNGSGAIWDNGGETLVVATHGPVKKSQKTPKSEIKKAVAKRKEYYLGEAIKAARKEKNMTQQLGELMG